MRASKTFRLLTAMKPSTSNIVCCQTFATLRLFSDHCIPNLMLGRSARQTTTTTIVQVCGVIKSKSIVNYSSSVRFNATDGRADEPLTKLQADNLVLKLTEAERNNLFDALQEFEANNIKAEYEGQLAATRWRSKFGRPSKLPTMGDVDPTGTFCKLSDDWLKTKYAENVPEPNFNQLMKVGIHNAVPFIGFGFLDNFVMIIAGDYIELSLGSVITISTMAAAALGNTFSDILGIGSAWYVEMWASKIGLKPPDLSPIQLDMKSARRFANFGRAIGITIGCLLGMFPLLFMKTESEKSKKAVAIDI